MNIDNQKKRDLATFQKVTNNMIATSDQAYREWERFERTTRVEDKQEIDGIIREGTLEEKRTLSRRFFLKDGFYRRIMIHYATILTYSGILIPKVRPGQSITSPKTKKKYYDAMNFCDRANFKDIFTHCSLRAVVEGCYYGIVQTVNKTHLVLMDLPASYCRTRYKDLEGNDIVEFDLSYFNTFNLETERKACLKTFPSEVSREYRKFLKGKRDRWYLFSGGVGVCFPLLDGVPPFLSMIPASLDYDEAVNIERDRDLEEIKKIIVQQIPHNSDNDFLLEPEEVDELHRGAVEMMKGNKNVSVLTTYADVDAIVSKTAADAANSTLEKMLQNIYSKSGTSIQLFNSNSNLAIEYSLQNDVAYMMVLATKYAIFITNLLNKMFKNGNIYFKYQFLPITFYNNSKFLEDSLKLGTVGYSLIMPALALGITQSDLSDIKDLENNLLELSEKLIPLKSSYTQSENEVGNGRGAPKLDPTEKSDKTIKNEESLQKQGGSK